MAVLVGVAELAVDLTVRALGTELVVQRSLAVVTGEAATVIVPSLGRHLLGFKHLERERDNKDVRVRT